MSIEFLYPFPSIPTPEYKGHPMPNSDKIVMPDEYYQDPKKPDFATQAEEPIEWRLLRAYENGFRDGLRRGASGVKFDHS